VPGHSAVSKVDIEKSNMRITRAAASANRMATPFAATTCSKAAN